MKRILTIQVVLLAQIACMAQVTFNGVSEKTLYNYSSLELDWDSIIDLRDSVVYKTVQIGEQTWMAENLKATKYSNDSVLIDGSDAGDITEDFSTKYYFWYNDDSITNAEDYGALYTWSAALNGVVGTENNPSEIQGVCPDGWHLPSDAEWKELEIFLGMDSIDANNFGWRGTDQGAQLKDTGTVHWVDPNSDATNAVGFTALPTGYRQGEGECLYLGSGTVYWTSTEKNSGAAWIRQLFRDINGIDRSGFRKYDAFSVRCIKNLEIPVAIPRRQLNEALGLVLYPNPVGDLLTIETIELNQCVIELYSINGQQLLSLESSGTLHQLDLTQFRAGEYFITIRSKDNVTTRKFIKL